MAANTLLTETLPTIVAMGVTAQVIETMFGKNVNKMDVTIIAVSPSKKQAEKIAENYRKQLKKEGKPYINRVKTQKVKGGYVIAYHEG